MEPQSALESVVNEELTCTQKGVADLLYDLIGPYKIYSDDRSGHDYSTEAGMKKVVVDKFARYKSTLLDSLSCEDYENEGFVELTQLREAILSLDEECDQHVLDYMLWYVYVRSESVKQLEYRVLVTMIEEQAKAKARPESSSPDKIKQRNKAPEPASSGDERYSEIDDPKESDYDHDDSPVIETDGEGQLNQQSYDDSPRQKVPSQGEPEEDDVNEDEMIDVAERIFIRVAEEIIQQGTTVRQVFERNIFGAEIDGEQYELLTPMGLLEGIKELGVDDLSEIEENYLLKVLSKPELDGAILMQELL